MKKRECLRIARDGNIKRHMDVIDRRFKYISFNDGRHLRLDTSRGKIDFWPATGKWIAYNLASEGKSIDTLILFVDQCVYVNERTDCIKKLDDGTIIDMSRAGEIDPVTGGVHFATTIGPKYSERRVSKAKMVSR